MGTEAKLKKLGGGRRRRVGLLGGSFDPPHRGHIEIAELARKELGLDEVVLMVAGDPYQKTTHASPSDRLRMTQLAAANLDGISVSSMEVERPGPSYTVDTVEQLLREDPDQELWLILGADALSKIKTWHRWQDLLRLVRVGVVPREPIDLDAALDSLGEAKADIRVLQIPRPIAVSSTRIRSDLAAGRLPPELAPAVVEYILENHLYGYPADMCSGSQAHG
jgi:nicotinate-nucleotide adenylyltransferase